MVTDVVVFPRECTAQYRIAYFNLIEAGMSTSGYQHEHNLDVLLVLPPLFVSGLTAEELKLDELLLLMPVNHGY